MPWVWDLWHLSDVQQKNLLGAMQLSSGTLLRYMHDQSHVGASCLSERATTRLLHVVRSRCWRSPARHGPGLSIPHWFWLRHVKPAVCKSACRSRGCALAHIGCQTTSVQPPSGRTGVH